MYQDSLCWSKFHVPLASSLLEETFWRYTFCFSSMLALRSFSFLSTLSRWTNINKFTGKQSLIHTLPLTCPQRDPLPSSLHPPTPNTHSNTHTHSLSFSTVYHMGYLKETNKTKLWEQNFWFSSRILDHQSTSILRNQNIHAIKSVPWYISVPWNIHTSSPCINLNLYISS